jgi:hypothetical protein
MTASSLVHRTEDAHGLLDPIRDWLATGRNSLPIEQTENALLVVWSKGKQRFRYVMGVNKAVEAYRHHIQSAPTVVIGDLNSNAIWDSWHPRDLNHTALITTLSNLGLVSSYHSFYAEPQGRETRPTCFLLWKE